MICVIQLTISDFLLLCEIQSRKKVRNRTLQNRFWENISCPRMGEDLVSTSGRPAVCSPNSARAPGYKISPCVMENAFKRDLRNYPLYFLLWTVLGLFYFSQGLTQRLRFNDPTPWWHYLVAWLLGVYVWALLTPAILWLGRRFTIERRNRLWRIALHLLLSAAFSVFELSLESVLYSRLRLFPTMKDFRGAFVQLLLVGFH